jgi:hypothetical protein
MTRAPSEDHAPNVTPDSGGGEEPIPDPRNTDHAAGHDQAKQNRENEPAA